MIPGLTYTNVSFVGSTSLRDELMLLGTKYAQGVIVTQVVPAVDGYSSLILEYKDALAKYYSSEAPDYVSLEGYVAAKVLVEALSGPERSSIRNVLWMPLKRCVTMTWAGTTITFSRSEHQGSHKVWGTQLTETGKFQPFELQ